MIIIAWEGGKPPESPESRVAVIFLSSSIRRMSLQAAPQGDPTARPPAGAVVAAIAEGGGAAPSGKLVRESEDGTTIE